MELTDTQKKDAILEQLLFVYIAHAFISPAVISLRLNLSKSKVTSSLEYADELDEIIQDYLAALIANLSRNTNDELVVAFIDKYDELFHNEIDDRLEMIQKNAFENFKKVLIALERDLDKPTTH